MTNKTKAMLSKEIREAKDNNFEALVLGALIGYLLRRQIRTTLKHLSKSTHHKKSLHKGKDNDAKEKD